MEHSLDGDDFAGLLEPALEDLAEGALADDADDIDLVEEDTGGSGVEAALSFQVELLAGAGLFFDFAVSDFFIGRLELGVNFVLFILLDLGKNTFIFAHFLV